MSNESQGGGSSMRTVLGVFRNRVDAEHAISDLEENGFDTQDLSIMMRDTAEGRKFAEESGSNVMQGAVGGAATGAVVGAIAIPGLGAILIGGPLASAFGLTGAAASTVTGAATGALAGGIIGALVGLGLPEERAKVYEEELREGAILLAVPTIASQEEAVIEILDANRASQIDTVEPPREVREEIEEERGYAPSVFAGVKGGRRKRLRRRRL